MTVPQGHLCQRGPGPPENPRYHRQRNPARDHAAGCGVAKVMQAESRQAGPLAGTLPCDLDRARGPCGVQVVDGGCRETEGLIAARGPVSFMREDVVSGCAVGEPLGPKREGFRRTRGERYRPVGAARGLVAPELQTAVFKIDVPPLQAA